MSDGQVCSNMADDALTALILQTFLLLCLAHLLSGNLKIRESNTVTVYT